MTLVFSLPILHKKAKITLIPGVVLAFSGFYLATVNSGMFSWEVFKGNFQVNYFPYLLAFMAAISWGLYSIFPTFLAYLFWDRAMRKGKIILVVSFSYFTPLLSIIISSLYLQVAIKNNLWLACGLVIAGAVICKFSIIDKTEKESA